MNGKRVAVDMIIGDAIKVGIGEGVWVSVGRIVDTQVCVFAISMVEVTKALGVFSGSSVSNGIGVIVFVGNRRQPAINRNKVSQISDLRIFRSFSSLFFFNLSIQSIRLNYLIHVWQEIVTIRFSQRNQLSDLI